MAPEPEGQGCIHLLFLSFHTPNRLGKRQSTNISRRYLNILKDLFSGSSVQFHLPSLDSSSLLV